MLRTAYNRVKSVRIDTSSSNVPTTYGSGSTSLKITGVSGQGYSHLRIGNETTARIAITTTHSDAGVPSSDPVANSEQMYCCSTSTEFRDDLSLFDYVYIRSDSGSAISTGIITIEVW